MMQKVDNSLEMNGYDMCSDDRSSQKHWKLLAGYILLPFALMILASLGVLLIVLLLPVNYVLHILDPTIRFHGALYEKKRKYIWVSEQRCKMTDTDRGT